MPIKAPKPAASSPAASAALAPGVRQLFEAWGVRKREQADHAAQVATDRGWLAALPGAIVAAAADPARLSALREERRAVEERLAEAPLIELGLVQAARDAGNAWSVAWHEWRTALEAEVLGPRRARLAAAEAALAAAEEELAQKIAEMPA